METNIILECNYCFDTFLNNIQLENHIKIKHNTNKSREQLLCQKCGKSFRDKYNLKRHWLKAHDSEINCLLCNFRSFENQLNEHYKNEHDIELDIQNHNFNNLKEFLKWKESIENLTCSKYVKGSKRFNKNGSIVMYYRCHRDGYFKSKSNRIRCMKTIGSNKINSKCPSHMRVCLNGTVNVKYIATHVGHFNELYRLNLTKNEKNNIADQLSEGVNPDDILDKIRNTIPSSNKLSRIHLTTKKDISNIITSYGLLKSNDKKSNFIEKSNITEEKNEIETIDNEIISDEEQTININSNVIIDCDVSLTSINNLDRKKDQFLDKMYRMIDMVENDEEMESVIKYAAPLDSIIKSLKCKKSKNVCKKDRDCYKGEIVGNVCYVEDMSDSLIETEVIAHEIIIE